MTGLKWMEKADREMDDRKSWVTQEEAGGGGGGQISMSRDPRIQLPMGGSPAD